MCIGLSLTEIKYQRLDMVNFVTVGRPAKLFTAVALFIQTMFMDQCISEKGKKERKNTKLAQCMQSPCVCLKLFEFENALNRTH